MSQDTPSEILYEDKFVRWTTQELILKCYYFPVGTPKIIPLTEIDQIWIGTDPELHLESFWKKKTWGMAFSNVFWAFRAGREFLSVDENASNFVVAIIGSGWPRSGFSVEDPGAFRALVEPYRKPTSEQVLEDSK